MSTQLATFLVKKIIVGHNRLHFRDQGEAKVVNSTPFNVLPVVLPWLATDLAGNLSPNIRKKGKKGSGGLMPAVVPTPQTDLAQSGRKWVKLNTQQYVLQKWC